MRSFASRGDCVVSDEPFYASYLAASGIDHPGRDLILESQSADWREVATQVSVGSPPFERPVWYQKHMAQHMREEMLGPWLTHLHHIFLVRHPARVINSYLKVFPAMTLAETGLPWQKRLFDFIHEVTGRQPLVVDASQLRAAPQATLERMCNDAGISWTEAMLRWPSGPRPEDGVWGPFWYESVWRTTGFDVFVDAEPPLPTPDVPFLEEAVILYDQLLSCCNAKIQPTTI